MKLPEYVTVQEVQRVCRELRIRDWTKMKKPDVMANEARIILQAVNKERMKISIEDFRTGLEVELEHGTRFKDANVTNNHPILTGKIVLAHLKESLDYYMRLDVAEIEGDLLKAVAGKKPEKVDKYFRKLVKAKLALCKAEALKVK
ncbi:MAG: hypothetical protein C4538_12380 [Nitrospiraceae bacterium]|nr:MAG: hypothetical protein C4538_12380 [Nitrospiraceae bacterium]